MGREKSSAPDEVLLFASRSDADRRIAGVAAAARAVRGAVDAGRANVWLAVPGGGPLKPATLADLERLAAGKVEIWDAESIDARVREVDADVPVTPAAVPSGAAVLRATGKATDGPVSRWINRPMSRTISRLLLHLSGVRPYHATIATAAITTAMFMALVFGRHDGLIAGGLLLQLASTVDGVDGEIARATWRTSAAGAAMDSAVDAATNCLFVLGLTLNLTMAKIQHAALLGIWGLCAFAAGLLLLGWRAARSSEPLGFDLIKGQLGAGTRGTGRLSAGLVRLAIVVTSRDFFALAWALLILAGYPMIILLGLALIATSWFLIVVASVVPAERERRA